MKGADILCCYIQGVWRSGWQWGVNWYHRISDTI